MVKGEELPGLGTGCVMEGMAIRIGWGNNKKGYIRFWKRLDHGMDGNI